MEIRGANRTTFTDSGAERNHEKNSENRALTVTSEPSERQTGPRAAQANPNRRNSAFLAHLTLQYADKGTQNRLIMERRASAIAAYASDLPSNTASRARTRRGVEA